MSMPFYVSPEQLMKDRADFARKGIARGRSVVAVQYADGVLFVSQERVERVLSAAEEIQAAEQAQVAKIRSGTSLREQLQFDRYLEQKREDPSLTLGEHMKRIGRHF